MRGGAPTAHEVLSEIKRIPVSMLCGVSSVASSAEVRFWEVMNMLARRLPPSDGQPFHDPGKGRVADNPEDSCGKEV
jgi:hypothetical protein